ncbi:hypothetical protein [Arthrobacter sp. TB 23]|uniref:hypothetical protein n=1 Tax=Arthrobacter sp. TB 23 TaxID=494419 RepID=UPI00035FBD6B
MLLAIPYLLTAAICVQLMEDGGPVWLNILVILFIWNAMKFLWIGPVSLVLLAHVRTRERGWTAAQVHQKVAVGNDA